jgi:stearoyl-CoA desaturase (delta-9 desaturase)
VTPHRFAWLLRWIDSHAGTPDTARRIDWPRVVPFIALHLACLAAFEVGASPQAVGLAAALFFVRLFAITGFYHRYFSHRAFKTSRAGQFAFALLGAAAVQRGPLWWASHHRHHHVHSDDPQDVHSPCQHGFFWSHVVWFLSPANFPARLERVRDLVKYPELRFLDRFDVVVPVLLATTLVTLGGLQLFIWGFCISMVAVYHATFTINSLSHKYGTRRYATADDSRNNVWLALLTLGEGWHNNHHHYPASVRQGFYWWEIDLTYYGLRVLAALGVIWDLRYIPAAIREKTCSQQGEIK